MALKGKTALVTGSSSGIGLGIAKAFAAHGMNVMLNGIEAPEQVEDVVAEVKSTATDGADCAYTRTDVSDADAVRRLVDETAEAFGSLEALVNNAGIQHVAPIEEFPDGKWDAIIAINLSSSFHSIKAAVPHMRRAGYGRIINVCSAHSLRASPGKAAYVAAKHALAGLTKVVALETARENITANAISPGYVWTPLVEKQIPDYASANGMTEEEAKDEILDKQASKEFATVEQIAALAVFLAGEDAAQITGANYPVDGGWTAS
ncbi:MAG: 3-hydroxybutyrate dehydrogenase [Pseudomonadota bacterium]